MREVLLTRGSFGELVGDIARDGGLRNDPLCRGADLVVWQHEYSTDNQP